MYTFTVIFEFFGGTYISQFEAADELEALKKWAANPNPEMLAGVGYRGRRKKWISNISSKFKSNGLPVPLTGLESVWCFSFFLDEKYGLVNVVKTSIDRKKFAVRRRKKNLHPHQQG